MNNQPYNTLSVCLGLTLIVLGLSIALGGDFYDSKHQRMIEFEGLHLLFGLIMTAVGIGWIVVTIKIIKTNKKNLSHNKSLERDAQ